MFGEHGCSRYVGKCAKKRIGETVRRAKTANQFRHGSLRLIQMYLFWMNQRKGWMSNHEIYFMNYCVTMHTIMGIDFDDHPTITKILGVWRIDKNRLVRKGGFTMALLAYEFMRRAFLAAIFYCRNRTDARCVSCDPEDSLLMADTLSHVSYVAGVALGLFS